MTASDLFPTGTDTLPTSPDWPDYDSQEYVVQTSLDLNDNGTVTITYHEVPLFDVDEFLEAMGTPEYRNGIIDALTHQVARKVQKTLEESGLQLPDELADLLKEVGAFE